MTPMKGKTTWIIVPLVLLTGCSEGVLTRATPSLMNTLLSETEVRIGIITAESELISGPGATGWLGDYKLENSRSGFVIQGNPYPPDARFVPGSIVDGAGAEPGAPPEGDLLFGLIPWFGETRIEVEDISIFTRDEKAVVSVSGSCDSSSLCFRTEYTLAPGSDPEGSGLSISTTISNPGASTLSFRAGDWLAAGSKLSTRVQEFPGTPGSLAAWSQDTSYIYYSPDWNGGYEERDGGEIFIVLREGELHSGESLSFTRRFMVSRSGLSDLHADLLELIGSPAGEVRITESAAELGDNPHLEIYSASDTLFSIISPDEAGTLTAPLPEGSYSLRFFSSGRDEYRYPHPVTVEAGAILPVTLHPPEPSGVRFQICEETESGWAIGPSPAKLTFEPLSEGDPVVQIATATGAGEVSLPPGIFRVTITRGPWYSWSQLELELNPGDWFELRGTLRPVFDLESYHSVDFHQYTDRSSSGTASSEEWLKNNLAEHLSPAIPTDTNSITEISVPPESLDLPNSLVSLSGVELKPGTGASLLLFPASFQNRFGWGGIPAPVDPREAFTLSLEFLTPRLLGATSGYLADIIPAPGTVTGPVRLDFPLDFVEINDDEIQLARWFTLLNSGYYITAVGGSGAGTLSEGLGFPRTLIPREGAGITADPGTEIIECLRHHRSVVSTGPRLRYRVNCSEYHPIPFFSDTSGDVDIEVVIESPTWMPINELVIYANGFKVQTIPVDFATAAGLGGYRFTRHFYLHFTPERDTWFVAVARGMESLSPIYPGHAFAVSNPIWVDVDGVDRDEDGRLFDPLFSPLPYPAL